MKEIKVVVIDDETPAREELIYLLNQAKGIKIVGEAGTGKEALALVKDLAPEVVFLDVQMGDMNGLEIAEIVLQLPNPPLIIFATAYNEYAVKAFEINALDYILKPFSAKRLAKTVEKIREIIAEENNLSKQLNRLMDHVKHYNKANKIPIDVNGKVILVDQSQIIVAFAYNENTYIKTEENEYITNFTLHELEHRLDDRLFFRAHRSFIINLDRIKEIIPWCNGAYNIILEGKGKIEVPVSRIQAQKLKKILGL